MWKLAFFSALAGALSCALAALACATQEWTAMGTRSEATAPLKATLGGGAPAAQCSTRARCGQCAGTDVCGWCSAYGECVAGGAGGAAAGAAACPARGWKFSPLACPGGATQSYGPLQACTAVEGGPTTCVAHGASGSACAARQKEHSGRAWYDSSADVSTATTAAAAAAQGCRARFGADAPAVARSDAALAALCGGAATGTVALLGAAAVAAGAALLLCLTVAFELKVVDERMRRWRPETYLWRLRWLCRAAALAHGAAAALAAGGAALWARDVHAPLRAAFEESRWCAGAQCARLGLGLWLGAAAAALAGAAAVLAARQPRQLPPLSSLKKDNTELRAATLAQEDATGEMSPEEAAQLRMATELSRQVAGLGAEEVQAAVEAAEAEAKAVEEEAAEEEREVARAAEKKARMAVAAAKKRALARQLAVAEAEERARLLREAEAEEERERGRERAEKAARKERAAVAKRLREEAAAKRRVEAAARRARVEAGRRLAKAEERRKAEEKKVPMTVLKRERLEVRREEQRRAARAMAYEMSGFGEEASGAASNMVRW